MEKTQVAMPPRPPTPHQKDLDGCFSESQNKEFKKVIKNLFWGIFICGYASRLRKISFSKALRRKSHQHVTHIPEDE